LGNGARNDDDLGERETITSICRQGHAHQLRYGDSITDLAKKKGQVMAEILTRKKFDASSPFEIKGEPSNLAKTTSRTTAVAFANDRAESQIPGLDYTFTFAVGNTLLMIWGMVLVMLMT
jgi:hypothetical protein